jgi:proteasome accessory factor C
MLPWLMQRGEVSVADMAAHFALTESELIADLELAAMCGLPPFLDEMIDVFIDEGTVFAGVPRVFTRPLRLTAPEGFGLLAAGRAAMALPGADPAGPLGRALDKLAAALGFDGVVVDLERPPLIERAVAAAESGERLEITYWTPSRDEATQRTITPRAVFADGGHWYVLADDHRSGSERSFRLDRVLSVTGTGVFDPAREVTLPDTGRWFADDPDLERVTLQIPTELTWMIERYPTDSVAGAGDGSPAWKDSTVAATSVVVMPISSEQWLCRLLLRIGPRAVVLSPPRWSTLAAEAARNVLARYETVNDDN